MDAPRPDAATPRRTFLRLLALTPAAAAAACAAPGKQGRGAEAAPGAAAPASAGAAEAAAGDALARVRAFPLPDGSEPAFVFRAAPARPRI